MEGNTNDTNEIIIRYLDGSASLEEKRRLLCWLKQSDQNRDDFSMTRDLWLACNAATGNELEVDIALEKLRGRILHEQCRMEQQAHRGRWHLHARRWVQAAAILLLLLSIGYAISNRRENGISQTVIRNQLITAEGSKGRFTLPDGSVVWLNAQTKLTYPDPFQSDKRQVMLEGEAYFEVAKEQERPFIVQAGEIEIEVLGTCFDISSYSSSDLIKAVLLSGSIKVSGKTIGEPIYMKPNDLFKYRRSDQVASVEQTHANFHADWIKDKLVFDNDCLSDILTSMEGLYHVAIECPQSFAQSTRLSFTIRQESIEEVMAAISQIIPIRYEIKDKKIDIIPE